ncbi:MAG TPA: von Willebrand factor type A domain-containing protein [Cytophagales bacterium]|nr:von Willebrand factor type A domain-containing protein [Cytophagales bacterium]
MNGTISMIMLMWICTLGNFNGYERKVAGKVMGEDSLGIPGVSVIIKGTTTGTTTDANGFYEITVPSEKSKIVFSFIGYLTEEVDVNNRSTIDILLKMDVSALQEVVVTGYHTQSRKSITRAISPALSGRAPNDFYFVPGNTEEYKGVKDNAYQKTLKNPLSTFSIDVDKASYSNVRRFIQDGQMPPKDAVRVEELINYFTYDYPQPKKGDPFSVNTEISDCPWNNKHKLIQIGIQGEKIATENLPSSNLVFLIDVSGSMSSQEKLPLVKAGFKLLIDQLRPNDQVAIVVYAGAAGLVLPSTSDKKEILSALEKLESGGSTAGGAGIQLAYQVAGKHFKEGGNNRVILATDGDFNVGISDEDELEKLIEEKRESGIFLSVLGFGMGNYKDAKMEILADKGNGNYAYIDNILEAKKVFVNEFGGTLFTIAKDVKLQIEFNPAKVKAYRLIGYENRLLQDEDFNNDKKDAGELGSGHTVTALYEIIPEDGEKSSESNEIDPLKYQQIKVDQVGANSKEIMMVKLRYKKPEGSVSKLIEKPVFDSHTSIDQTSDNFRFSAAVASFGMLLRDSEFKGEATFTDVLALAKGATGKDSEGYRAEFLNLVRSMDLLAVK